MFIFSSGSAISFFLYTIRILSFSFLHSLHSTYIFHIRASILHLYHQLVFFLYFSILSSSQLTAFPLLNCPSFPSLWLHQPPTFIFFLTCLHSSIPLHGSVRTKAKNERQVRRAKKRKGIEAHSVKPPTPTRAIDVLILDEEKNGKQKKEEKERNRGRAPNRFTLDHLVTSYDPHG